MKLKFWPRFDPASMSSRARGYLLVATFHFGLIGLSILLFPQMYSASAFIPLIQYTHLWMWGGAYLLTSVLCCVAAITQWPTFARAGLTAAFVVLIVSSFAVGWGVVNSWLRHDVPMASPVVPLSFAAIAIKDLLMVAQPLRTPTEDQTQARADREHA